MFGPIHESPPSDAIPASGRRIIRACGYALRIGVLLLGLSSTLPFASSTLGATATVRLGSAARPSVLGNPLGANPPRR